MTDPDRALARKAQRGDRQALVVLYEMYRARLLGFLVKLVGQKEGAEDVFQEVWIKVIENIDGYRPQGATFRAWLFRIAFNAAVDRLRREGRRAGPELDAAADGTHGERFVDRLPADGSGPEREGVSRALGRELSLALARLPEKQRSAVLLRHQQGLSYRELARALGVAQGTAKVLVHRGVRSLRPRLAEWNDA